MSKIKLLNADEDHPYDKLKIGDMFRFYRPPTLATLFMSSLGDGRDILEKPEVKQLIDALNVLYERMVD